MIPRDIEWLRGACSRRAFLHGTAAGAWAGLASPIAGWASALTTDAQRAAGVLPEYDGTLDELLFVYDQCVAPHLLRQMVEILRLVPPHARIHSLVSRERAQEARAALEAFGFDAIEWIVTDEPGVSGNWARDILQIGRGPGNARTVHVPWDKSAREREDLERTWRKLRPLAREGLGVDLLPIAGEGGNMIADRGETGAVLFAGSTIAVETRALTRSFWGFDPGDEGVANVLSEAFGLDQVHWIGPRSSSELRRQSEYVFHVDMIMTLLGPGKAVVARCDPGLLDEVEHREIASAEAARTIAALERREAAGMAWPADFEVPRDPSARRTYLEQRVQTERRLLEDAAGEMESAARLLQTLGYQVHRIDSDPRRVRRYQSATNVVCARDRLLVPLFPTTDRVHGWVMHRADERASVDVDLGVQDSDFELSGDNLARVEFYRRLHPQVRAVRDYFYLASGNVHCVVGRLS